MSPPAGRSSSRDARTLERLRATFGRGLAARKIALLRTLERTRLHSARDVSRFHETLLFMRAYPDDERVRRRVERLLARFQRRTDLRRFRTALADSGIAGTEIWFRFFEPTARWMVERWPDRLAVDWDEFENVDRLEALLPTLALYAEAPGIDELDLDTKAWIERMKGPRETDAAFLVRRLAAVLRDGFVREKIYDGLDVPMRIAPGPTAPSRTLARVDRAPVHHQKTPLDTTRPDLASAARRVPTVRSVSRATGQQMIDLARISMITRARDLDAFSWADPADVRMVDFGDGLQFACMGQIPERRLMLESVYGYLTLHNGVPIGYVLTAALFGSAEVAYNVFETFRGAEAAAVYGRVVAMTRHLFGVDTLMIPPYQLGDGNDEALQSGAWWFYQKLGFRPRNAAARRLMNRELARMKRSRGHRSSIATLERLAAHPVYWHLGAPRADVMGRLPLAHIGDAVTRFLARRYGSRRDTAAERLQAVAMRRLGVRSLAGFSRGERLAWKRWSPLIAALPGVAGWSPADKRALVRVVRAKGGRRESDFVARFDAHARLRRALLRLGGRAT